MGLVLIHLRIIDRPIIHRAALMTGHRSGHPASREKEIEKNVIPQTHWPENAYIYDDPDMKEKKKVHLLRAVPREHA